MTQKQTCTLCNDSNGVEVHFKDENYLSRIGAGCSEWRCPGVRCARPGAATSDALDLNACRQPAYPAAALALRAEGRTTVEVQVGAAGQVLDARVAVTSGNSELDAAALAGVRSCAFHAVAATGQAPTGWLKTQYVWVAGAVKQAAPDPALFDNTKALAESGDPAAQNRLGTFYEHGTLVKADLA